MNCKGFEELLEEYLAGELSGPDRRNLENHAGNCSHCRRLLAIATGNVDLLSPETSLELTLSILDKTSGPACFHAQSRLCDLTDNVLSSGAGQILRLHLDSCPDCRTLAATLTALESDLPEMAELEPDDQFAAEVFQATSVRKKPFEEIRESTARWWHNLVRRPRFAWEAAYAGALVVFLAFGNIGGAWRETRVIIPDRVQQSLVKGRSEAALITEGISSRIMGHRKQFTQSLTEWNNRSLGYLDGAISANVTILKSYRETTADGLNNLWVQISSRSESNKKSKEEY